MSIEQCSTNDDASAGFCFSCLESYEQYREITRNTRKKIGTGIGNFTLLPNEAKMLINSERLLFAEHDYGLFVLKKHAGYFQLYFTVAPDCGLLAPNLARNGEGESDGISISRYFENLQMPVVCEIPYMESDEYALVDDDILQQNEQVKNCVRFLENIGFSIRRTSRRLAIQASTHASETGCSVVSLPERLCTEGLKLIQDYFDVYCDYIPTADEWENAIQNERVLCILNDGASSGSSNKTHSTQIAALLYYDVCGAVSELRHLFVSPKLRGNALANKLVLAYLNKCANLGVKSNLWVRDDNLAAQHIYNKCGYKYDGVRAIEMIANL